MDFMLKGWGQDEEILHYGNLRQGTVRNTPNAAMEWLERLIRILLIRRILVKTKIIVGFYRPPATCQDRIIE